MSEKWLRNGKMQNQWIPRLPSESDALRCGYRDKGTETFSSLLALHVTAKKKPFPKRIIEYTFSDTEPADCT